MRNLYIIFILSCVFSSQLYAQKVQKNDSTTYQAIEFGVGLNLAFPFGKYKDANKRAAGGVGFNLAYRFEDMPFSLGFDFAFMGHGSDTRDAPFSTTVPDIRVDVETDNSLTTGDIYLRISPNDGSIQPYIQGMIGFNYLSTETEVKDKFNTDPNHKIASSKDMTDLVFSYGVGGGLLIPIHRGFTGVKNYDVLLNIDCRYRIGGTAEYLKIGDKRIDNGRVINNVTKSVTDMLAFRIGVLFRI